MDTYGDVSAELARLLTRRYSTSFSSASRLFPARVQKHIYTIYALVRIADEIVDTFQGPDKGQLLDDFETECARAAKRGYSTNPIVHAFTETARQCGISDGLTRPFFKSMRQDISVTRHTLQSYKTYIYGSAEVVGLMCLRVFCGGDKSAYARLAPGAQSLGAAYQKVNFLRDIAADHTGLGRYYFPIGDFDSFDDTIKSTVTADIRQDFNDALPYIRNLPKGVRPAVIASYRYYERLLRKLEQTPAETIKRTRIRLPAHVKAMLLASQAVRVRR